MRSLSRLSLAVAAILSLVGTGLTWTIYRTEVAGQQAAFDILAQRAARRIEIRIEQHLALLTATRAFFEVHPRSLEREVFAAFVSKLDLDGQYSGLQGIGVSQLLPPASETDVEAGIRTNYDVSREVWPEAVPGLRTAIILLEPNDARNRAALGFDMFTEAHRRTAMLQALEEGKPMATAPVELVQEITQDVQAGILIYMPFYRTEGTRPEGFVYAPLRMGDLFTAALAGRDLPLELRATDARMPDLPLFESPGYSEAVARETLASENRFQIAGRDWILSARPGPDFDDINPLRYTFVSGIIFALLVLTTTFAVHWQGLAIDRSRALGEMARRSAEQKDLLMREMVHRLKNMLARVSGIARQTARETSDKTEMVSRLHARLQAMAAAQDLLIASKTDGTDLEDLIRAETDQISGTSATLSGPAVPLTAQQTHALALVFHELATNSLKYGAAAQERGRLNVTWSVEKASAGQALKLLWQESTSAVTPQIPDSASGFGTRLLSLLVGGELGGTIERHPQADGLRIELSFPL
ncbi:CHASE domain-containing protein [Paracoccus sp. WLY502]|uniref:CHASE domain-containing protein n=1 Tax=Paracoccus yibinensis TaxID=3068891 RepID=UPI002796BBCC|nr:CHASE domain-containing protein [Paracoccus sp. WLY502]MDQ1902091.1 CHASE domain-containing protein [Paracoccus sp. WLY502]